jgi:hypothetical protein
MYHRQPWRGASEVAAELDSPTLEALAAGTIWACAPSASYPTLLLAGPYRAFRLNAWFAFLCTADVGEMSR